MGPPPNREVIISDSLNVETMGGLEDFKYYLDGTLVWMVNSMARWQTGSSYLSAALTSPAGRLQNGLRRIALKDG
jgi:hypothetical protein